MCENLGTEFYIENTKISQSKTLGAIRNTIKSKYLQGIDAVTPSLTSWQSHNLETMVEIL
jgi:hypothetical protein